jgi:hypothetical protein
MKDEILQALDNDYLLEIENTMLGHLNQTPKTAHPFEKQR